METGPPVSVPKSKDELMADVRAGRLLMKDYKAQVAQLMKADPLYVRWEDAANRSPVAPMSGEVRVMFTEPGSLGLKLVEDAAGTGGVHLTGTNAGTQAHRHSGHRQAAETVLAVQADEETQVARTAAPARGGGAAGGGRLDAVGMQRLQREDEAELLMAAEVADEQAVSSQPPPADYRNGAAGVAQMTSAEELAQASGAPRPSRKEQLGASFMVPSEGEPPALMAQALDDSSLRERLQTQKKRKLTREAEDAGVPEDQLDEAEDSSDPKAALIELIVAATRAKALSSAPPVDATIPMEPEPESMPARRDDATASYRQMEAMARARVKLAAGGGGSGKLNIKERLDKGEWKQYEASHTNWWQTDMAEQVNRLRAAARIRDSLPEDTKKEIQDLYPQLVVLGDGNTGKSTVLNRFAEFAFSAVTDGVCTRRPVRLQLRPVLAEHRKVMEDEGLLAICTMEDKEDQYIKEFKFRKLDREADEDKLRRAVEDRASEAAQQDGTAGAYDRQYIEEELVITIEADQMIYFDLLDLPGLDNSSKMPKKMVRHYINQDTLAQTFVLIFAEHREGDTQLMHR
eukprot:COSAG06_NODE_1414_length_9536_cov_28.536717_5_plen_574_part_00